MLNLVSKMGGLIGEVTSRNSPEHFDPVVLSFAHLDDSTFAGLPASLGAAYGTRRPVPRGIGSGVTRHDSTYPAIGEAVERLCTSTFRTDQFIIASAQELGGECVDWRRFASCNAEEYADPKCPVRPFDKAAPMRWVLAFDPVQKRRLFVPAVMVYLQAGFEHPGERFWLPTTSGCAAHRTFEDAMISAICELFERDMLMVTWLRRMRLPHAMMPRETSGGLQSLLLSCKLRYDQLQVHLFDATSDVELPCLFAVERGPYSDKARTLVSCSCATTPLRALEKVLCDVSTLRHGFHPKPIPQDIVDFSEIFDGATYMARAAQEEAFAFLLDSVDSSKMRPIFQEDQAIHTLGELLKRIEALGLTVLAVDISTDEALRAGLRVVRVIMPELMPISFSRRARFLATPRLWELPAKLGLAHQQGEPNPDPLPFA